MTLVYATLEIDNITVQLSANPVLDSYGVPGSPEWITFEDMQIESLEILGLEVNPNALPSALVSEIYQQASDWIDESDWQAIE